MRILATLASWTAVETPVFNNKIFLVKVDFTPNDPDNLDRRFVAKITFEDFSGVLINHRMLKSSYIYRCAND